MDMLRVVLPVIVTLFIGMLFREKNIIEKKGADALQALVMNVALPVGLFSNFYKTSISVNTLIMPLTFFIITNGGIFVGKLLCKLFKQNDSYMPFMLTGYEAGMLGYALLGILLGANKISTFAMMDMGHVLAIFTVYTAMVKSVGGEKQTLGEAVKGILSTPVLIAIIIGIIFGFSGLGQLIDATKIGPVISELCSFLSAPTSVAILIVIGYRLKLSGIDWTSILKASGLRIIMQAVFTCIVLIIFNIIGGEFTSEIVILSALMMIILPPPYVLPLYIKEEEQKEFYSSALSVYTLFSIIGFIIIAGIVLL